MKDPIHHTDNIDHTDRPYVFNLKNDIFYDIRCEIANKRLSDSNPDLLKKKQQISEQLDLLARIFSVSTETNLQNLLPEYESINTNINDFIENIPHRCSELGPSNNSIRDWLDGLPLTESKPSCSYDPTTPLDPPKQSQPSQSKIEEIDIFATPETITPKEDEVSVFKELATKMKKGYLDLDEDEDDDVETSTSVPTMFQSKFNLTESQSSAVEPLLQKIHDLMSVRKIQDTTDNCLVLEGAAGTGKTYVMSYILDKLMENYSVVFCSPTHEALKVIRENLDSLDLPYVNTDMEFSGQSGELIVKTLASFLCIKMQRDLESGTESFVEDKRKRMLHCDILCIDESSMISKDQIKLLLSKLGINFRVILFVGDEPQLPSPSDGEEGNGVFELPHKYELTEVVRQKEGSSLLNIAWWIRGFIKNKDYRWKPSQLLTLALNNDNDCIVTDNPNVFMDNYFKNETNKRISGYTNALVNQYNEYVRNIQMYSPNQPLKIYPYCNDITKIRLYESLVQQENLSESESETLKDLEETFPNILQTYVSQGHTLPEYCVGETLICTETNQKNEEIIHTIGELFVISKIERKTETLYVTDYGIEKPIDIDYWEILDTTYKTINIVCKEYKDEFKYACGLLYKEANTSTAKDRFKRYWKFKTKFSSANYLIASTLHKLQGSTVDTLYFDTRDLDKYYSMSPKTMYSLIYVALTRPKEKIIILT